MNDKKPGYCEVKFRDDEKLFCQIAKFIGKIKGKSVDIGIKNSKIMYLQRYFNVYIHQYIVPDLNFDKIEGKWDNIFCFETLEHLQNPLWHVLQLKSCLNIKGNIYFIMPCRPRFMWKNEHFFEMSPNHFEKWILKPLSLKIVKKSKIYPTHSIGYYFLGIHEFLRLFFNATIIYKVNHENI